MSKYSKYINCFSVYGRFGFVGYVTKIDSSFLTKGQFVPSHLEPSFQGNIEEGKHFFFMAHKIHPAVFKEEAISLDEIKKKTWW